MYLFIISIKQIYYLQSFILYTIYHLLLLTNYFLLGHQYFFFLSTRIRIPLYTTCWPIYNVNRVIIYYRAMIAASVSFILLLCLSFFFQRKCSLTSHHTHTNSRDTQVQCSFGISTHEQFINLFKLPCPQRIRV